MFTGVENMRQILFHLMNFLKKNEKIRAEKNRALFQDHWKRTAAQSISESLRWVQADKIVPRTDR